MIVVLLSMGITDYQPKKLVKLDQYLSRVRTSAKSARSATSERNNICLNLPPPPSPYPTAELVVKPGSRKQKRKRNVIEDDDEDEAETETREAKKAKTDDHQDESTKETTLTEDDILPAVPLRAEILAGELGENRSRRSRRISRRKRKRKRKECRRKKRKKEKGGGSSVTRW